MKARADLLALTPEDLAALSNRGLAKRAQREHGTKDGAIEVAQAGDGTITATYADGAKCTIPPGAALNDRCCTCASSTICRHLLGAILAYLSTMAGTVENPEPWNPGAISDEMLSKLWKPVLLSTLRKQFDEGQVIEVVCAIKPVARFHSLSHIVRFLAPGDPAYTVCDCADPSPCRHVPLAVWAFRRLQDGQQAGLISTGTARVLPEPIKLSGERHFHSLFQYGIAGSPPNVWRGLERLEAECRDADLMWPADVLAELLQLREQYEKRDARFTSAAAVLLMGEWLARIDALAASTGAAPELFLGGSSSNRASEMGAARLVGLGCGLHVGRKATTLTAYLQDVATGSVAGIRKQFVDVAGEYSRLARTPTWKSATLFTLGNSQIMSHGGKCTAGGLLSPGRSPVSIAPQSYQWEKLRPPVLVESAAELAAHRKLLPPALLRPRRLAEDLHIFPVNSIERAGFLPHLQQARADLLDAEGGRILLVHSYHGRGRGGMERLLAHLETSLLRFVAGNVRLSAAGLEIAPIGLVFETNGARWMLQPWIEEAESECNSLRALQERGAPADPIRCYWGDVQDALGELLLNGIEHAGPPALALWKRLSDQGYASGFLRAADAVEALRRELTELTWQSEAVVENASNAAKRLSVLVAFALAL